MSLGTLHILLSYDKDPIKSSCYRYWISIITLACLSRKMQHRLHLYKFRCKYIFQSVLCNGLWNIASFIIEFDIFLFIDLDKLLSRERETNPFPEHWQRHFDIRHNLKFLTIIVQLFYRVKLFTLNNKKYHAINHLRMTDF